MQNLAVQPPSQNTHSIKVQNGFKPKAGAGTNIGVGKVQVRKKVA